jgi:hypothetical protein
MLSGEGKIDYLVLKPDIKWLFRGGTFEWVEDVDKGQTNAAKYFPHTEGINVAKNELFLICKVSKSMFVLNLDNGKYRQFSTKRGLFDGQPDQIQRILNDEDGILYFTEEGGVRAGIHARNQKGQFFTVLESPTLDRETTGVSFSPNGLYMYVAYQDSSILFEVSRKDGLTFKDDTSDVKYYNLAIPWL